VLRYSQDAGGRRRNRLTLPERAALQLLGHPTLETNAGLIGHRPDLLAQLLIRRHHHHLHRCVPLSSVRSQQDGATRDHYGSSVRGEVVNQLAQRAVPRRNSVVRQPDQGRQHHRRPKLRETHSPTIQLMCR